MTELTHLVQLFQQQMKANQQQMKFQQQQDEGTDGGSAKTDECDQLAPAPSSSPPPPSAASIPKLTFFNTSKTDL